MGPRKTPRAGSDKEATALRLDRALLNALRQVKQTDGIPVTTAIEFAVRDWLKQRGIVVKAPPAPARRKR